MRELNIRLTMGETGFPVVLVEADGVQIGMIQSLSLSVSAEDPLPKLRLSMPADELVQSSESVRNAVEKVEALLAGHSWLEVSRSPGDPASAESPLALFLAGIGRNSDGMTLDQVLSKDDSWFERGHDFIQWILPTRRRSQYAPSSPVLTDSDVRIFQARRDVRENYAFAIDRVERFLCLDRMRPFWVRPKDHNHKRITRLLESLRDLGCNERAARIMAKVMAVVTSNPDVVDPATVEFWKKAVA